MWQIYQIMSADHFFYCNYIKMKSLNLQNKFVFSIGTLFMVTIALLIFYFTFNIRSIITENAYANNEQTAATLANQVDAEVEIALDAARTVSQIFDNYNHIDREKRRLFFNNVLENLLSDNANFLCIWTVWEPNALDSLDALYVDSVGHDKTGRFVPAWYRVGSEIKVQPNFDYAVDGLGDYYQLPKKTLKETIIGPYLYDYQGKKQNEILIISLAVPIMHAGKFVGVAGVDIAANNIQKIVDNSSIQSAVYSNTGVIAAHFDKQRLSKQLTDTEKDLFGDKIIELSDAVSSGNKFSFSFFSKQLHDNLIINSYPIYFGNSPKAWAYITIARTDELLSQADKLVIISLIIGVICFIIIVLILVFLIKSIVKPITQSIEFAQKLSQGDLTATIQISQKDEVGKLVIALSEMSGKIKEVVTAVISNTDNIVSVSSEISSTAMLMSEGASQQAASIEEISSSMDEISSTIQQNTDNSQQTEKIATKATGEILQGSIAVNKTLVSMKTIAQKVSIISEIALQTNILALNAAVEAARAGEHGRGFAVVAAEVRKLAERSQKAAKEIDELSESSVEIAEQTGKLFTKIVPVIQDTARLVQEISASSTEQSNGANQVSKAIQQLNKVAQQNAAASEELATNAEEMTSQADNLQQVVSFFKLDKQIGKHKTKSKTS